MVNCWRTATDSRRLSPWGRRTEPRDLRGAILGRDSTDLPRKSCHRAGSGRLLNVTVGPDFHLHHSLSRIPEIPFSRGTRRLCPDGRPLGQRARQRVVQREARSLLRNPLITTDPAGIPRAVAGEIGPALSPSIYQSRRPCSQWTRNRAVVDWRV